MPGWYQVAANATDSNTLGPMLLHAADAASDPYDDLFPVVAYNPLAATNLGLSALPTASPAASGGLPTFGTGTGQVNPSGGKVPATLAAGDLATDSITAAAVKADAVTKVQAGLASQASVDTIDDFLDTEVAAIKAVTDQFVFTTPNVVDATAVGTASLGATAPAGWINAAAFAADAITAAKIAADAVAEIQSGLASQSSVDAIDDLVDTEIAAIKTDTAAIKAKTDNLPAAPAAVGDVPTAADNLAAWLADADVITLLSVGAALDTMIVTDGADAYEFTTGALANAPSGGAAPTVAQIRAEMDANSTKLARLDVASSTLATAVALAAAKADTAAILADTAELQADWANGGRLDLLLDAAAEGGDGGTVTLDLAQTLGAPRALDSVADTAMTVGDALWAATVEMAGDFARSGATLTKKTPATNTTVRTLTFDSASAPTSRT